MNKTFHTEKNCRNFKPIYMHRTTGGPEDHRPLLVTPSQTTPHPEWDAFVVKVMTVEGFLKLVPLYKWLFETNQCKLSLAG